MDNSTDAGFILGLIQAAMGFMMLYGIGWALWTVILRPIVRRKNLDLLWIEDQKKRDGF